MSICIVGDNCVCRSEYVGCRAVILLKLYDGGVGVGLIEVKNILDSRAAEAVDALVVVTYYHNVASAVCKQLGKHELRVVSILVLVNEHVAEFVLIVSENVGIALKELYRKHNDIVKVDGVVCHHLLLIELVDIVYMLGAWVTVILHILDGLEIILSHTDGVGNRLGR